MEQGEKVIFTILGNQRKNKLRTREMKRSNPKHT